MTVTQNLTYPNTWFKGLVITHKKVQKTPSVGLTREIGTEFTKFGWVIISLENEIDLNNRMLSKASIDNYEKLCDEKFLLQYIQQSYEEMVHNSFKQ